MVDHDEEMALEPPRKRPELEWEEARGREEEAWRLEPEGETEVPETGIVADGVEGNYVDSNGEGHHGRGKVKNHRSQSGVHCAGKKQKYGQLAAHHCASRRTRRSHDVIFGSELQQFPFGRPHLVGLWEKREQQVVVRDTQCISLHRIPTWLLPQWILPTAFGC